MTTMTTTISIPSTMMTRPRREAAKRESATTMISKKIKPPIWIGGFYLRESPRAGMR
jgi:hypothetical protein